MSGEGAQLSGHVREKRSLYVYRGGLPCRFLLK